MQRTKSGMAACLTMVVMLAGGVDLRAEVAACSGYSDTMPILIAGITEGPDPIPQMWEPIRDDVPETCILNPGGHDRGDGVPSITLDPQNNYQHVTWAYRVSEMDFDIAYSNWTGTQWSAPLFLTATAEDEIDPKIHVADNAAYIVWWVEDPDRIFLSVRLRGDQEWSVPQQVGLAGNAGRRPSIVEWQGAVVIAAEQQDILGGGREILVSTEDQNGFTTEVVATAPVDDPLHVLLHVEQGKLWMDWRHSDIAYAYTEFVDDDWTTPTTVPWTSSCWPAIEMVRLIIRGEVLSD